MKLSCNDTKLLCLWQTFISTSPFLHSWIDLSPLGWCGRWLDPAQPATHNERFHRDGAPHVPDGRSSAQEMRHTVNIWFYTCRILSRINPECLSLLDCSLIKTSTSETLSGPPNLSMSSSNVLRGSSFPSMDILWRRSCFISSILAVDGNKDTWATQP